MFDAQRYITQGVVHSSSDFLKFIRTVRVVFHNFNQFVRFLFSSKNRVLEGVSGQMHLNYKMRLHRRQNPSPRPRWFLTGYCAIVSERGTKIVSWLVTHLS